MKILVLALCSALAACAPIGPSAPVAQSTEVKLTSDQFDPADKFEGPATTMSDYANGLAILDWELITSRDKKTGVISDFANVIVHYSGQWRYYVTASDEGATALDMGIVSRTVDQCGSSGCTFTEEMVIKLRPNFLMNHKTGFRIKLSAKSGDTDIIAFDVIMVSKQMRATGRRF